MENLYRMTFLVPVIMLFMVMAWRGPNLFSLGLLSAVNSSRVIVQYSYYLSSLSVSSTPTFHSLFLSVVRFSLVGCYFHFYPLSDHRCILLRFHFSNPTSLIPRPISRSVSIISHYVFFSSPRPLSLHPCTNTQVHSFVFSSPAFKP